MIRCAVISLAIMLAGCAPASGDAVTPLNSVFKGSQVTLENYLKIQTGMTYSQVVEILGEPGEELSRSSFGDITTVMYSWKGKGSLGANMNAMFQNDRLISKAQFGLR
jgi:hypothetical protein